MKCSGRSFTTVVFGSTGNTAPYQLLHNIANAKVQSLEWHAEKDHTRAMDTGLLETNAARALASADPRQKPLLHNIDKVASNELAFDFHDAFNFHAMRQRRQRVEALWHRAK